MENNKGSPRERARALYEDGFGSLAKIAEEVGENVNTIKSWKKRDKDSDNDWIKGATKKKLKVAPKNKKGCTQIKKVAPETVEDDKEPNWLEIETEYIRDMSRSPVTYKELAGKYKVSESTIDKRAATRKWTDRRKKYARAVQEKTLEKMVDEDSTIMANIKLNILSKLQEATEELNVYEEVNGFGKLIYHDTETVRTNKLQRLTKTIGMLEKSDIEKNKLELEKIKNKNNGNKGNEIVEGLEELREVMKGDFKC